MRKLLVAAVLFAGVLAPQIAMARTHVVFLDEMQNVDVLKLNRGELTDDTPLTEKVLHIDAKRTETIKVVWSYMYYRIGGTRISMQPFLQRVLEDKGPPGMPEVSQAKWIEDPVTGRRVGVEFTIDTRDHGIWTCNLQVECRYFNERMGREYVHRRPASFWITSFPRIDEFIVSLEEED